MWDNRGQACDEVTEPTIPTGGYIKETDGHRGNDILPKKRRINSPAKTAGNIKKKQKKRAVVDTPDLEGKETPLLWGLNLL